MQSELFVAQLDWSVTEEELGGLFTPYGEVTSVRIPVDKMTGKKRGFGFVAMGTPQEGQAAVEALNDWEYNGRNLVVKFAEPKPQRSGNSYGGGQHSDRGSRGNW